MKIRFGEHGLPAVQLLAFSATLMALLFIWEARLGFSLMDEGFLWYGVQRVMQGEVPLRDFMSYDPGRYYWSALLMSVSGENGIVALRAVVALFQLGGVYVALRMIAPQMRRDNAAYLLLSAVTVIVWMFPRHKLFDITLSVLLVAALASMIAHPGRKQYFLAGVALGLIAVFGRNHGLYGAVAGLAAIIWLAARHSGAPRLVESFLVWGCGVLCGFTPVLLMAAFVPGFADAFADSIRFLFEYKSTNLPLPVPWPWLAIFGGAPQAVLRGVLIGLFFIFVPLFGLLALASVLRPGRPAHAMRPAFVAAAFLALPYAHFAYSRADLSHLAQGIFPALLGTLVWLSAYRSWRKWLPALVLCGTSLVAALPGHAGWLARINSNWVKHAVGGDTVLIDPSTAADLDLLQDLADRYAQHGRSFVAVPLMPGAYAALGRKAPTWEIYPLFSRSAAFEHAEISRISNAAPGFVLISDVALDGRDELRFHNTHPLTERYLLEHFEPVQSAPNTQYRIYRSREVRP